MLKNLSRLEHKIGDRVYHLFCDQDSPLVEVKDALSHFLAYAVSVEKAVSESQKQPVPEPVQEPVKQEPKAE